MASSVRQWYVCQDGCIPIGDPANSVTYHSSLNSIIVTTNEPAVKIYDVTSGSVLHKSNLSAEKGDQIHCMYLAGKNKVVFYNKAAIGVRSDLHGVLLLDTGLQTPIAKSDELINLELPLADAYQFLKAIQSAELTCTDYVDTVVKELDKQINVAHDATKGNHKTTKWATVCIRVPHAALKTVSAALVMEMRRLNIHSPGLSIASAVTDRLGYLLPNNNQEQDGGTVERTLMYSEAARRETFRKWPHMNYKWALPDPMAQAGFYHQPNVSGDDRAMCFTCNVCLVCWEPTDEPWSEHERHSPSCPFVKGEHTQNVPLSVTYATQPALKHTGSENMIECVSHTSCEDYIATSSKHGNIIIWSLNRTMKKYCQFVLNPGGNDAPTQTGSHPVCSKSKENVPDEGETSMEDNLVLKSLVTDKGADDVDAIASRQQSSVTDEPTIGDSLQDIPLHEEKLDGNDSELNLARPNKNVNVTSMCIVEKKDSEAENISSKRIKGKKDSSKKVNRGIHPSLICGVSICRTKHSVDLLEGVSGELSAETEVEKMNRMNEVVSAETSPITPPEIIASSHSVLSNSDGPVSTSSRPCILVVAVKEDVKKVSKQPSTDSLKPSTSSSNIVNTMSSLSKQDWPPTLDYMYDSDPDVQIVKVTPGPQMLSASSPTEGTKMDDLLEGSLSQKLSSNLDSSNTKSCQVRAGTILQRIELPQELQCEKLSIRHIKPTLDQQHLVVVLSREFPEHSAMLTEDSKTSVSTEISEVSGIHMVSSGSSGNSGSSCQASSKLSSDSSELFNKDDNKNCSASQKSFDSKQEMFHGCILLYRFNYNTGNNFACIEEKPVAMRVISPTEGGVEQILVLPREMSDQTDEEEVVLKCDEDMCTMTHPSQSSVTSTRTKNPIGLLAVIHSSGGISVVNSCDLTVVASIVPPDGDRFVDVTYCSGIDRLCLCSALSKLYFYQLSEEMPDQSDSLLEGESTPASEIPDISFSKDSSKSDDLNDHSTKVSDLLAKQDLSFESLSQLHNLIQFENLMPRFTATVPPCWTEIQQEQQQRRHPQHLQHQGEATQHTRTWKLQPDISTWDEHLFEIVLPRMCCVGHVDVKFTLNPHCAPIPKVQFTLLKQNINALGKQQGPAAASTPVDSKINFNIGNRENGNDANNTTKNADHTTVTVNNVLNPEFLERHNAKILCGPVDISDCLDLSGNSGIVSLTSPQLLMSKPRSFLLHIKGFMCQAANQQNDKSKKKKMGGEGPESRKSKTIKLLFDYSTPGVKAKMDNLKGCDTLTEISVTIRKTKKANVVRERFQRYSMIELSSFHEKLLSTVSFDEGYLLAGVSADHVQNMCLDILIWVTNIQMNDPDHRVHNKCILTVVEERLKKIVQACYIQGTRTTAHKCSRLLSLCLEYSKTSADQDLAPVFSLNLLEALLDSLPFLPCAYSAGALKWFFTLLNRVKCMNVINVASKCSHMLNLVSKHFHEHASPLSALLKARYGLNGNPFECDMFDMELPQAVKQFTPGYQPSTYFSSINSSSTQSSGGTGTASQTAQTDDDYDFYNLFSNPPEKSTKSLMECARNHILGMLEVEPLHFTCHSTSDGTKMERLDNTVTLGGTTVINPVGLSASGLGNSSLSGTINFGETLPSTSSPYTHFPMPSMLPYNLQQNIAAAKHQLQELSTKNYPSVKHKIMHIKQILQEVGKSLPMSTPKTPSGSSEQMPSTPKTTPQVMTPPLTPPNEAWQQMLSQGDKSDTQKSQQRPGMTVQTPHSLLQPPAPQVLVIERIYSGARRFVILDFGKPILLTDVIIPLCGDLASLSIDVWVQGEEVDGQRLVVASDIGFRSLVMNNIMPPPVCRFLKITTIGRYGSGTTRSKIPIGAFYGHSYILPWEWNTTKLENQPAPSTSSVAYQLDFPTQSQLLSHLGSFMSLLEDIQCRYSLARTRLEALLLQTESLQYSSFLTQFYLKKNKKNDEDNSILQAYNDCLQLQLQQNLASRAIDRLQSAIGLRLPTNLHLEKSDVMLKQASSDKLRFLLEHLLETVISITNSCNSIPQLPTQLYSSLDEASCQNLFKYLCLHGNPRIQILTGMVLVRVCGSQPWFGDFLGNMLQEYFNSETMQVFSQDRVFILLTAMGQRSLQGPAAISIMESLLQMLARVLSPVLGSFAGGMVPHTGHLDLSLIGWILLFLCRNLDSSVFPNGNGEEDGASRKDQGTNLSNRWNFIQANSNVKSQMGKSRSSRLYRRSLQKRLLIHKQKLMDLEHVKKNFVSYSPVSNHALLKQHDKQVQKELSQYTSKHLKDIIQIRRNDALKKIPQDDRGAEDREGLDYEPDSVLILPKQKCLPVVHGLMALLLGMDFTCNVDLFLVTCKVLARICISTRPAITLMEAMNQDQLERLIMLTTNLEFNHGNISWGGPWAGHALTCLLQDLLEGERVYPGNQFDGITDDEMSGQMNETDDSLQNIVNLSALDSSNETNQQSDSDSSGNQAKDDPTKLSFEKSMVQMLLDDADDEDDLPEKLHAYVTGEKNNAPSINPSTNVIITGDMDDQIPKPSMSGYTGIKAVFGSTSYHQKPPPVPSADSKQSNSSTVSQGLSTALDTRLESGLETCAELKLRMMLFSQSDTLQGAFTSQLPALSVDAQGRGNSRVSPTFDDMADSMSNIPQVTSYDMLSRAYDDLFGQLPLQRVNMDTLLQLWLTLNEENSLDNSSHRQPFDPCRLPIIPLNVVSIKNLLATAASVPALPIRTWVMVFQCLTLTSNLKVSGEEPGIERSMVVPMIGDPNLVAVVTKFLSGAATGSPASSSESQFQVGPSAVQVFYLFLQRLHVCMCGEDNIHRLKEIMLKLVYSLTAERGAFHSGLGPLDAQCKFLDFILELTYDQVDIYNAISVTESISSLVHQHIVCQERVTCKSTSDVAINCRACFGGLFSSLLRGSDSGSRTRDVTRDQLMCSLLKVVNGLLHVQFPPSRNSRNTTTLNSDTFHGQDHLGSGIAARSEPLTDSSKLSHAMASSPHTSRSRSDEEKVAQTDEQKTETANLERIDTENQGTMLADIILGRRTIMYNFILALSYCNSSTMAMILGSTGMPSNMQDSFTNGHPLSVGDGIYQILVTLSKKCNDNRLLMDSLFMYLSGGFLSNTTVSLCRLSEPILWFILKVLDSSAMLKLFLEKGGVEVVCRNFVNCNSRIISTTSSLISTIMQNMNGKGHADKKKYETDSTDGLQNFAPLGTISSSSPTASPAEVLIVAAPHHRRARSAPWSYHFYPDEGWVDLKIVLPFAILLKEVQIQPHSPALSTCPSFVSLEASQDGVTMFPLCSPMNTSSLVFIKLQLQKPEVVTTVTVRLHKARDSMTIGLSQILLMGYSAFGESGSKSNNLFLPTEDIVSRSSVGWIRLLHHCLTSQRDMEGVVAEAAAPTPSLLNTCTALLVSPISTMYAPTIETVLLKLGLHSGAMGLALIDNLLRNSLHSDSGLNSQYLGKVSGIANDSTVEILYQLGTVQDRWTSERVQAMLLWLGDSARVALQRKAVFSEGDLRQIPHRISHMALPGPAPSHVHCVAAVLWRSGEIPLDYNLSQLITKELVSSLYEWSSVLEIDCHLKKAVDYTLCAICHICPDAFGRIMEWMGIVISPDYGFTASITDDGKDNSQYHTMTDDSKEAINALGQQADIPDSSPAVVLQEWKHMCLDEAHLSTLALTCKSELASRQLLESGFPAVLAQGLFEFCNRVVSNFADSWSQPEGITDSCKSMSGNTGENNLASTSSAGIAITADMVAAVLNFFSEVSSRASMKDWLGGADGNIFWPVLLTMLCNTPLHSPISVSALPQKYELISVEERAAIETASVNFFCNVIACHIPNQMLFSKVLFDVIKEQGSTGKVGLGVCPLSGFTRRLFLQVLLEDDKILVSFRAPQQYRIQIPSLANQIQHPQFGAGRRFKTMFVNMHTTIAELTNKVSDTPSIAAQLLDVQNDKKADKDSSQIGLEIVENICAANTIEVESTDKGNTPVADSSKLSVPPRPPTRRGRQSAGPLVKQLNVPTLSLYHKLINNQSLPMDMCLSQLLQVLQNHGLPQGHCVIDFTLQLSTKDNGSKDLSDDANEIPDEVLLTSTPYPTALQVFASVGGLALLAEHLPLLYPEISRQITTPDSTTETQSGALGDTSQDWVQIDSYPEELYELYEPMSPAPPSNPAHNMCNPSIPPHSLIAFGLFLRLPGYAEVLLKERKKAQCLLRLVLGVTDDGEGGHILTSPISASLPTLPFIVLKSLFDTTPLTTDDGVLLRRMCLDIGALHLILACMSVLSHHAPRSAMSGFVQDAQSILNAIQAPVSAPSNSTPYVTEEKSQQYWAKGTGFGTGSTTSSWDAEQALIRQKSEEEHVTCLLQVLASYINPGGGMPEDYNSDEYEPKSEQILLPEVVPEMLSHSCLVPALSSYLRNDSVLDMARHVPLYRSLLLLLRAISTCPPLAMLLLPLEKEGSQDSVTGVGELLDKMRGCVDTYASRLKSNKTKTSGTKEEEEENEGLAMLIPDIQETARIVQKATQRVEKPGNPDDSSEACNEQRESLKESFDEVYLSEMKKLQFSQYEMVTEEGTQIKFAIKHHYEHNVKTAGDIKNPNRIRRLAQEAVTLSTSLPLSVSSSVFVRCDEERLDIMKVLITGPEDTPYANGCFEFDVYFPQDYPNAPPHINLETTGNQSVRFNPNLYNDGKVCLSVLNTWHGRPEEKWSPQTSSFLQVLVSIQSLILVCEPYFNEPGYERSRGTPSGTASSREYDSNIRQATVKWAILEQLKTPSPAFKDVIHKHFWLKRHQILKQCEEWIGEMETYSTDKRTGRTIAHSTLALKKHYNQLREEFAKFTPPEGLEDYGSGDIDPKEKHYQTDSGSTSAPQVFPPDSNANSLLSTEDDLKQEMTNADC